MYRISDKLSVIHTLTVPSELFLLASRMRVTITQRAAMVPCTCSQIKFMDTLAPSEEMTYLDQAPMGFTLAIHTGGFICFQYELRKRDYTEGTKQARPCSITWLTEIYQSLPVGSVIMPHAVFFFTSLSNTGSHCSSVPPLEHLGKASKSNVCVTSLTIRFSVEN